MYVYVNRNYIDISTDLYHFGPAPITEVLVLLWLQSILHDY